MSNSSEIDRDAKILQLEADVMKMQTTIIKMMDVIERIVDQKIVHIEKMDEVLAILRNSPKIRESLEEGNGESMLDPLTRLLH